METSMVHSTSSPSKNMKSMENKSLLSSSTLDKSEQICIHHSEILTSQNETKLNKPDEICLQKSVYGIVKWYNVKFRYGFIKRFDTQEDVFVHKNGIKRSSPNKAKSIGDGEVVQFDIFQAEKGPEARNVTGPEGKPARASRFARIINRFVAPNYMRQTPQPYRQFANEKFIQKRTNYMNNMHMQRMEKSNEIKNAYSPVKAVKIDAAPNQKKIFSKQSDENTSKTTKESGYSSTQEKTASTSAIDKTNPNLKKRKSSKKIIYIIKDERSSGDLNEYLIKDAIQKSVGNCSCTTTHI